MVNYINRWIILFILFIHTAFISIDSRSASIPGNPPVPYPATDALGREVLMHDKVGPLKPNRCIGIFYFLWHNQRSGQASWTEGPYDISKITARDPEALQKPDSPLWGPIGMYHYWGEPLYGYYLSTDPWVLRRHAFLLADAGVDVLIFDTTNAVTYRDVYIQLCEVFQQIRREDDRTPQIAFMVNTKAGETAQILYEELYQPGLYQELWFHWEGKPLLICDPEHASPELKQFFTLRRAHWPFQMINTAHAWHWEAAYPQPYGYTDSPTKPEQVNVSVAQNLHQEDAQVTNMSTGHARGRSFHDGVQDSSPNAVHFGHNIEEQWKRVFELQPPFVMITGWNEWIAGRWGEPGGPIVFVDQYDQEFSRDIEPMKGGHGDNYYWQMVSKIRQYKGLPALPKSSPPITIAIEKDFEQWNQVEPEFKDHLHETAPRDYDGSAGLHYLNKSGRNDFTLCKVSRDEQHVYFYIRTRDAITLGQPMQGMSLLINIDQNTATGWEGYDYIVQFEPDSEGRPWLAKNEENWLWKKHLPLAFRAADNHLHLAIPRAALGIEEGTTDLALDFKWADNLQQQGDIMDFYLSGDVAPEGRFMYRYTSE